MRLLLSAAAALTVGVALLLTTACNPSAYNNQANANSPAAPAAPAVATAPPSSTAAIPPPSPIDGIRRVTVQELKQALDEHRAVVVDVRNDVAYKNGHIQGALLIPATDIDKHLNELPKDKLIVTYCS